MTSPVSVVDFEGGDGERLGRVTASGDDRWIWESYANRWHTKERGVADTLREAIDKLIISIHRSDDMRST